MAGVGIEESETAQVRLSKSKIAAFQQCPRKLWLQIHRPWLSQFDSKTLAIFECGHRVGALAQRGYPSGILVSEDHRAISEAVVRTRELLSSASHRPIFEAAFVRDNVVVRTDILEPDGWGGWRLIEVKNAARVKEYQLHDIATQAWVLRGNRVCLSALVVSHVDRVVRPSTPHRMPVKFVHVDVTRQAMPLVEARAQVVARAQAAVAGPEPGIAPGPHCQRPPCEFRAHCQLPGPTCESLTCGPSAP